MKIKQFGLQRSGTNYTKFLLEKNYNVNVVVNKSAWKHGFFKGDFDKVIVTVKNPYAWIVSSYNYFCRNKRNYTISKYIQDSFSYEFVHSKNPIVHWNRMNNHWLNEIDIEKLYIVKYENLCNETKKTCDQIASFFNLKSRDGHFYNPKNVIHANSKEDSNKTFDMKYYSDKEYTSCLSEDDIININNNLDKELLSYFLYNLLEI